MCGYVDSYFYIGIKYVRNHILMYVTMYALCMLLCSYIGVFITGVPAMVPNVTVDVYRIDINGNIVTLTLSWGEPFNNLDPIVNYTVSCSGDVRCPLTFNTTENAIIFTNLTPMTTYTFSVVATNSIGIGEAGVVMITTPGKRVY